MRILTMKKQNDIYKRLINIIIELRARDTNSATDAISDAFDIAYIVGGDEMLEAMCPPRLKTRSAAEQFADILSRAIDRIDGALDEI